MCARKTRKNPARKRSLWLINEHFEANFNAVWPSAIVFNILLDQFLSFPSPYQCPYSDIKFARVGYRQFFQPIVVDEARC